LAAEWKRIGFIDQDFLPNWTDSSELVDKFVDTLRQTPNLQYLHFIGGETVITPAFKTILSALVDAGLNSTATVGFTTNLTVWDEEVINLLTQFHGVNLGVSIETMTPVNDYVRWPSKLPGVLNHLERWREVAQQHNWLVQIRTTPTLLSIGNLLSVYDYAWQHCIAIESCNFLEKPEFMRTSVLPFDQRQTVIGQMQAWLDQHSTSGDTIINTRDPNIARAQIAQDLQSYVNYLRNAPDESHRLPDLVKFLHRVENSRGNCILDYLPEYENLFRSAGY
jgi:sulfatase maturation enzyme AslB (radical SAM superfamily)